MLPVAASADKSLPGGVWRYIGRRARRILPPYYAALALVLILEHAGRLASPGPGKVWSWPLAGVTPQEIVSHLLLAHNLRQDWADAIDGPMWSVATEWQIYFLFPLILLPAWRRLGRLPVVVIGFVVGLLPALLLRTDLIFACPWYLGLFAMGMVGALLAQPPAADSGSQEEESDSGPPWKQRALGFATLCAAVIVPLRIPAMLLKGGQRVDAGRHCWSGDHAAARLLRAGDQDRLSSGGADSPGGPGAGFASRRGDRNLLVRSLSSPRPDPGEGPRHHDGLSPEARFSTPRYADWGRGSHSADHLPVPPGFRTAFHALWSAGEGPAKERERTEGGGIGRIDYSTDWAAHRSRNQGASSRKGAERCKR